MDQCCANHFKTKGRKKDLRIKNIRLEPNQNVNDLEKQHPISLLKIVISLVPSISKLGNCYEHNTMNRQT
jgi:hypothetical protein